MPPAHAPAPASPTPHAARPGCAPRLLPRRALVLVAALLAALPAALLPACARAPDAPAPDSAESLTLVATVGMVADLVSAVAGDRATVHALMGPGVDPHLYAPTRSDIAQLLAADAVFAAGLHLEGKMSDALARAAAPTRPVVFLSETVDPTQLIHPDDLPDAHDPHLWMDPALWAQTIPAIRDTLAALDPDHAAGYRDRAAALESRLAQLDADTRAALHAVPPDARVLVTAHDAFHYLARRYGYEVVAIQGISTESEAGVRDIERLVDVLVSRRIPAVFVESTVSDRNIRALIAGAAARGHTVTIGGELFSDAMGPAGTPEGTYTGMIEHNARTIAAALAPDSSAHPLAAPADVAP
jgi:manganese/zinc/iron transport system substrate-binding protein